MYRSKYKIIGDMHTHSNASTHAYSTITELVKAAGEKGLEFLAVTDHSHTTFGRFCSEYFSCLHELPIDYRGVKLIVGVEANINNFKGELDIELCPEPQAMEFNKLNWVIASVHEQPGSYFPEPTVEKSTEMWLSIANNPRVNVIGHSGSPKFRYDLDAVIPEFGRNHKLVEINAHSFDSRESYIPNCRNIALACKKYGVPVIVNSDAHFEVNVGNHEKALKMLEEIDFPEELIINADRERLWNYIKEHTNTLATRK